MDNLVISWNIKYEIQTIMHNRILNLFYLMLSALWFENSHTVFYHENTTFNEISNSIIFKIENIN